MPFNPQKSKDDANGIAIPKAVIAYNPHTGLFKSGQVDLPDGFKHYIIKFKEDPQSPTIITRISRLRWIKAADYNKLRKK